MKHQRNWRWLLSMVLTFAMVFSNVHPVAASELVKSVVMTDDEADMALDEAEQQKMEVMDEVDDEDAMKEVTAVATPSNAQKPEDEDDWSFDDELEDDQEADLEEVIGPDELDEPNSAGLDKTPILDDEVSEGLVGIWSDKPSILIDGEEEAEESLAMSVFDLARGVSCPTYAEVHESMTAMKDVFYEGMTWTNFEPYGSKGEWGDAYWFQGGAVKGASGGVGCAGYAFRMSDNAFGTLPARVLDRGQFTFEDVKVGDILRVNNNSHFVIVWRVGSGGVTVTEGNYNKSVHWGRSLSKAEVMAATFLVTRYPVGYSEDEDAGEVAESGTEGNLTWTLTNGGKLTISGSGAMKNYTVSDRPSWDEVNERVNELVIEDGIENIGDYAFYKSGAMGVYIPESVTTIGTGAFQEANFVAASIPGSISVVNDNAFRGCGSLTSVTVAEGVSRIGDNAFRGCTSLEYADFPASITEVGESAFLSCGIKRVRFVPGTGNVTIGDSAFAQCWYLTDVTLPQSLDKISNYMFQSCTSLASVYIPASVSDVGENPFTSTYIQHGGTIQFGGSEATWRSIGGQFVLNALPDANIIYDVPFDDPFAEIPGDPGDAVVCPGHVDEDGDGLCDLCGMEITTDPSEPTEPSEPGDGEQPCEHVDADGNGVCDKCGEAMSTGPVGPTEPTDPIVPIEPEKPGDGEEKPSGPDDSGEGDQSPVKPDEGNTGGNNTGSESKPGDAGNNGNSGDVSTPGGSTGSDTGGNNGGSTSNGGSNGSSGGSSNSGSSGGSSSSSSSGGSSSSSDSVSETTNRVISTNVSTNVDGKKVETTKWLDGTVVNVATSATGVASTEVLLPKQVVDVAQREGKTVTLPVATVQVTNTMETAATITVKTGSETPLKVLVPVTMPSAGTVAVVVGPDGVTQVVKGSTPIDAGVVVSVADGETVKIVDLSKQFADVPVDAWYKEAVNYVAARDLFNGVTETTFNPAAHMTCATLVTALARLDGVEIESGATWYAKSMEWAIARGLVNEDLDPENIATSELIAIFEKYFEIVFNDELPSTLTRAEAAQVLLNLKRCKP